MNIQKLFDQYAAISKVLDLKGFIRYARTQKARLKSPIGYDEPIGEGKSFYDLVAGSGYEIEEHGYDEFVNVGKKGLREAVGRVLSGLLEEEASAGIIKVVFWCSAEWYDETRLKQELEERLPKPGDRRTIDLDDNVGGPVWNIEGEGNSLTVADREYYDSEGWDKTKLGNLPKLPWANSDHRHESPVYFTVVKIGPTHVNNQASWAEVEIKHDGLNEDTDASYNTMRKRVSFRQDNIVVDASHPFKGAVGDWQILMDDKPVGKIFYRKDGHYGVHLIGWGNAQMGFGESVPEAASSAIEALTKLGQKRHPLLKNHTLPEFLDKAKKYFIKDFYAKIVKLFNSPNPEGDLYPKIFQHRSEVIDLLEFCGEIGENELAMKLHEWVD